MLTEITRTELRFQVRAERARATGSEQTGRTETVAHAVSERDRT
jgi:hypothetical protein